MSRCVPVKVIIRIEQGFCRIGNVCIQTAREMWRFERPSITNEMVEKTACHFRETSDFRKEESVLYESESEE